MDELNYSSMKLIRPTSENLDKYCILTAIQELDVQLKLAN